VAGKGTVVRWERLRRQNHWFDASYNRVRGRVPVRGAAGSGDPAAGAAAAAALVRFRAEAAALLGVDGERKQDGPPTGLATAPATTRPRQ